MPKSFILSASMFSEIRKIRTWSNIYRKSENQFHAEFDADVEIVFAPGDNLL